MTRLMRMMIQTAGKWCVWMAVCLLLPQYGMAAFTAYHDCALRSAEAGVSGYFSTNSSLVGAVDVTVPLTDSQTGSSVPVSVRFFGDGWNNAWDGNLTGTLVGSDAYQLFQNKVPYYPGYQELNNGAVAYFSFSGLDPAKSYTFALMSGRPSTASYSNRFTKITLSGADVFTNASSVGVEKLDADATCRNMAANEDGRLMKYTGVRAGSDGVIQFSVAGDTSSGYMNAFMLQEFDAAGGSTNVTTTLRYFKGTSEASSPVDAWRARTYDDSGAGWANGAFPFGYGDAVTYGTSLTDMKSNYLSLFIRLPFTVTNKTQVESMTLTVDYDDGFAGWINGTQVAISNPPASLVYNIGGMAGRESYLSSLDATKLYTVQITDTSFLVDGANVLALQGWNTAVDNSDFMMDASLQITYMSTPQTNFGTNVISVALGGAELRQFMPANRRTHFNISEIMYNPLAVYGDVLEFVEIQNTDPIAWDISGYRLSGDIAYVFPNGTTIGPTSYLVVAKSPSSYQSFYGKTALGPYSNLLSNSSGSVRLRDETDGILCDATYSGGVGWPASADGVGHSLVLAKPDYGEGNAMAYIASSTRNGNPGGPNRSLTNYPLANVVINEFLSHTDPPQVDFIELYNAGTQSVNIGNCYLTDDPTVAKFRIPAGTTLAARGYTSFDATTMGFNLSMHGETLCLINSTGDVVLDAVKYEAQENGVAYGRHPDGAPYWSELTANTRGTANAGTSMKIRDIVINEIMFNPISGDDNDEYIELYNRGASSVDLGNWRFSDGLDFMFPQGTVMQPGAYLVVAKNLLQMRSKYTNLNSTNSIGDYDGTLANGGEHIALVKPDDAALPNQDFVVMDEVTYADGWGKWTDAGGASLELKDPNSDNRFEWNWAGSDESAKSAWKTYSVTDTLTLGLTNYTDSSGTYQNIQDGKRGSAIGLFRRVQFITVNDSECLIDDVKLIKNGSENVAVDNGSFESDLSQWYLTGNHKTSYIQNEGATGAGSKSLRLVATGDGDLKNNQITAYTENKLYATDTATMSFQARWIAGSRVIIQRLAGGYIEQAAVLDIPNNLGTPGAVNSRKAANGAGPALSEVTHFPLLPASSSGVSVKARVVDPSGISSVQLHYRKDPEGYRGAINMVDNGTSGDELSGDGIYTAKFNPDDSSSSTLYAFKVVATDVQGNSSVFPADAPSSAPGNVYAHEGLVMFNQAKPVGGTNANYQFGTFRLWMTQQTRQAYQNRFLVHENNELPTAVIYDNARAVYEGNSRYRGSGWNRCERVDPKEEFGLIERFYSGNWGWHPIRQQCFAIKLPKRDRVQGAGSLNLDNLRIHGGDAVYREPLAHHMLQKMGQPWEKCRMVEVYVNETRKSWIYQDAQFPGGDYQDKYSMPGGEFFELTEWKEVSPYYDQTDGAGGWWQDGVGSASMHARAQQYKRADGTYKRSSYRMSWGKKAGDPADDYMDSFYPVLDALSLPLGDLYEKRVSAVVDDEAWMRVFAIRHLLCDWDGYGFNTGKNMYYYVPREGKSSMVAFDLDIVFDGWSAASRRILPDASTATWNGGSDDFEDPAMWQKFFVQPKFKRAYLRAIQEMCDTTLKTSGTGSLGVMAQAYYDALNAAKIPDGSADSTIRPDGWPIPMTAKPPSYKLNTWITDRRNWVISQLSSVANAAFSLGTGSFSTGSKVYTVSGNAPIQVTTIKINGQSYPIKWTGDTAWQIQVPMKAGATALAFTAHDRKGVQIGGTQNITATFTGTANSPSGQVVISEIMYNPVQDGGGFVELYNRSSSEAFDLGGYKLAGADFVFPFGSYIGPTSYVVVAQSEAAFARIYGTPEVVIGQFTGSLQNDGELVELQMLSGTNYVAIDSVRYDDDAPWPAIADGGGASLQLLDVNADNSRVANWASAGAGTWQYVTVSGTAGSGAMYIYLDAAGDCYIDDLSLTTGGGANLFANGGFESGLTSWTVGANMTGSAAVTTDAKSGSACLHLVASSAGSGGGTSLQQTLAVAAGQSYTLSYWYKTGSSAANLIIRFSGSWISSTVSVTPSGSLSTPGKVNNVSASFGTIPSVWINEVMPQNTTINDNAGEKAPWVELYNTGSAIADLGSANYYLTDDYGQPLKWKFPTGQGVGASSRLVIWCDSQTAQTAANNPHASFTLNASSGVVALVQVASGRTNFIDYFSYNQIGANRSYGLYPEGDRSMRQVFDYPTAGTVNNPASVPRSIKINEWMADNSTTLVDPADGDTEDWIELYNPGSTAVDLTDFMLSDVPGTTNAYKLPNGTSIPAFGYLIVWADNESGQTDPGESVHASFGLSAAGESIYLYSQAGTLLDSVTFGAQEKNISNGRYGDGGPEIFEMAIPTPATSNRLFVAQGIAIATNGAAATVNWATKQGRGYRLMYRDTLQSPWVDYGAVTNATGSSMNIQIPLDQRGRFWTLREDNN